MLTSKPTLSLKKINPDTVKDRYLSGFYNSIKLSENVTNVNRVNLPPPIFQSDLVQISLKDKNNMITKMVATTPKSIGKIRCCTYCSLPIVDKEFGRPVSVTITEKNDGIIEKAYTTVGTYNTLECMYTDYKQNSRHGLSRSPHGCDGETLIKQMVYDLTGKNTIRDAYDPAMLETRGGNMTPEEYTKSDMVLSPSQHLYIIPASTTYVRDPVIQK